MSKKIKVAIVGASGHTGLELLRLLPQHPYVEITVLTSERYAGKSVGESFPSLQKWLDRTYEKLNIDQVVARSEVIFAGIPHTVSMKVVPQFIERGKVVIDLSADFRLQSEVTYAEWYGEKHPAPNLLKKAVYGLPEIHRKKIREASLIANPGCYPTSSILALAPLLQEGGIDLNSIVIDSKSGVSGAGRSVSEDKQFVEVHEGVKAYKVASHRHTPEIEQELSLLAGVPLRVSFTPHLIPMSRGMLTTAYLRSLKSIPVEKVHQLYQKFYQSEPFIRLFPLGQFPNTAHVRGTNFCDIGVAVDRRADRIVIVSAIDNLVKGASGQAIQNMNIRFGWDEMTSLLSPGFIP